jgi:uncharacterized protein
VRIVTLIFYFMVLGLAGARANSVQTAVTTGNPAGTYFRFGHDIADLAAHFGIQVEVQPSAGSLENIEAMLHRHGTQLGIVQSDVLDFIASFSEDQELRSTAARMRMVFPLYAEEVHLLARPEIVKLADLAGKRVAIGAPNSGTLVTATLLLETAGVDPAEERRIDTDEALEALRDGQVDAMFYVAGRPAKLFQKVTAADGLHFVPITEPAVRELYPAASITSGTYAWQKEEVPTVAVRAVLMTYDWSKPTRYQRGACDVVGKVARIVADNLEHLRQSDVGHSKWRDVDLKANLVNWKPSSCAEEGLNGPVSYVLPLQSTDCGDETSAIRRKLCEVKERMRQERHQPAASLQSGSSAKLM